MTPQDRSPTGAHRKRTGREVVAEHRTPPEDLRADCARCEALCCVGPPFQRSADFAISKPAGTPCPNLADDFRCRIHDSLRDKGFRGCLGYDCLGAGQKLVQRTFAGTSWRDDPGTAAAVFAVLPVMRALHELLRHLDEAARRTTDGDLREVALGMRWRLDEVSLGPPDALRALDLDALRRDVGPLLEAVSAQVRRGLPAYGRDHAGADLVGARLAGADLRGASLRGTYLMGADLRGADLRQADLLGADLRGADLTGADVSDALYCLPSQFAAAAAPPGGDLTLG